MNIFKMGKVKLLTLQITIETKQLTEAVSNGEWESAGRLAESLEAVNKELEAALAEN